MAKRSKAKLLYKTRSKHKKCMECICYYDMNELSYHYKTNCNSCGHGLNIINGNNMSNYIFFYINTKNFPELFKNWSMKGMEGMLLKDITLTMQTLIKVDNGYCAIWNMISYKI